MESITALFQIIKLILVSLAPYFQPPPRMSGGTELTLRVPPSPLLPDDQANKVDQLVTALERSIASNQTGIGEGP